MQASPLRSRRHAALLVGPHVAVAVVARRSAAQRARQRHGAAAEAGQRLEVARHLHAGQQRGPHLEAVGLRGPLVLHALAHHHAERERAVEQPHEDGERDEGVRHLGVVEEQALDARLRDVADHLLDADELRRRAQRHRARHRQVRHVGVEGQHVPDGGVHQLEVEQDEPERGRQLVVAVGAGEARVEEQLAEHDAEDKRREGRPPQGRPAVARDVDEDDVGVAVELPQHRADQRQLPAAVGPDVEELAGLEQA
mmetsp:Transcript_32655/g.91719  ORF Transcript_32655/g.91719 Transcript_32655/m.91719 type:complete len:254 (+) Transcript_32655:41-802(+)